ncbi:hypothetical protein V7157_25115 [Neobacillus drentensis]|uniref:hypothetical protein n=1 Tax=Neobacillus drentensis TaxID=220684 RepID=UPI003002AC79
MKFTLFLEASTLEETKQALDNFKRFTANYDVSVSVSKVEEYWKIEDMYKALLEVNKSSECNVKTMLSKIASKWLELPDEYLASKTMDDCEIYIPNLYMITLNMDD